MPHGEPRRAWVGVGGARGGRDTELGNAREKFTPDVFFAYPREPAIVVRVVAPGIRGPRERRPPRDPTELEQRDVDARFHLAVNVEHNPALKSKKTRARDGEAAGWRGGRLNRKGGGK